MHEEEFDQETIQSLREAAKELRRKMNEVFVEGAPLEKHVHNSWPVHIPTEWQTAYNVSPYGRKALKGDKVVIHSCPLNETQEQRWLSVEVPMIAAVEAFVKDGSNHFNQHPVKERVPRKEWDTRVMTGYEKALFEKLTHPIVLVNPSPMTIWNAHAYNPYISVSEEWGATIEEEYIKIGKVPQYATEKHKNLMHYLGPNGGAGTRNWVSLVPNPQRDQRLFSVWSVDVCPDECHLTYQTKRTWSYAVPFRPFNHRWCAESVDKWLGRTDRAFWLESSVDFNLTRSLAVHADFYYLNGEIPDPAPDGVREDADYVWDVPGSGTYMSRRHAVEAIARMRNKKPVPLEKEGYIPVGYQTETLVPMSMHKVKGGWATLPVCQGPPGHQGDFQLVSVSCDPTYPPLPLCPGLFFTYISAWEENGKVYANMLTTDAFLCRDLGEVSRRLPLICSFLRRRGDVGTIPYAAPPGQVVTLANNILEAGEEHLSLGSLVKKTNVHSGAYMPLLMRSRQVSLIVPGILKKILSVPPSSVGRREWSDDIGDKNPLERVLIDKYGSEMLSGSRMRAILEFVPDDAPFDKQIWLTSHLTSDLGWIASLQSSARFAVTPAKEFLLFLMGIPWRRLGDSDGIRI